jgi:hypothetical protein
MMSAKQIKLLWPTSIAVAAIFMGLLFWASAGAKAVVDPHAGNFPKAAVPASPATIAERPASASLSQGDSPRERIEAELISIGPNGFEPAEITRPAGRFLLAIQNRSGLAEITLLVNREDSHARFLTPTRKKRQDWRDVIAPPPGRYVLTEANHPEWHCTITITSH